MRIKKPIGLGLLTGLLALAFAALPALAAAAPTFAPSSGGFPVSFTGTSGTSVLAAEGIEVVCADDTSAGTISGPSDGQVTVTFTGCRVLGLVPCASGEAAEEIVTEPLHSRLVYLDEAQSRFGIELAPAEGAVLASFSCGGVSVVVTGSVLGEITAPGLGETSSGFALNLAAGVGGGQEFTQVEETGKVHRLEASIGGEPPVPAVEVTEEEVTYTEREGKFIS